MPAYSPGSSVAPLILALGDRRAESFLRKGDIWGQAIQGVGNAAAGAAYEVGMERQQAGMAREQAQRDAETVALLRNSENGQVDPAELVRIHGPEKGLAIANGWTSYMAMREDIAAGREDRAFQRLGQVIPGIVAVGGPQSPLGAETIREITTLMNDSGRFPGKISPEYVTENFEAIAQQFMSEEPPELERVELRQPDGSTQIQFVPKEAGATYTSAAEPEKPDARGFEPRAAEAIASGDMDAYQNLIRGEKEFEAAGRAPTPAPAAKPLAEAPEWKSLVTRASLGNEKLRGDLEEEVQSLLNRGDTQQAKEIIVQAAISDELADDKRQIVGRRQAVMALKDIQSMFDELEELGIDTGVFRSGWEAGLRKIGETSNPKVAELQTRLDASRVIYRRAMTGVAFNPQEAAEYDKLFPAYLNEAPTNKAIIDGMIRSMGTYDEEYWTRKLGRRGAEFVGALGTGNPFPRSESSSGDNPFRGR